MKKEGWEIKKLEDVGIVVTGNTPKTSIAENYDSEDICFVKPSDISNEGISLVSTTDNYISEFARGHARILPIGSVLVTCIGIIGKTAVLEKEAATNQQINSVIPSENIINKFLAYALLAARDTLNHMSNAPVVPIINKTQFSSLSIPVPPLPIQEQIVKELDTLSDIIVKKKEQLTELDTLAQATFYDMFGDPVENEKGWEKKKLGIVCTKIGSGSTPKGGDSNYKLEGISLIRSLNIHNSKFLYDRLAFIDDNQAYELRNVIVEKNDILLNITGASVARCCIVPTKVLPARVNQHVSILRIRYNIANPIFIERQIISYSYQHVLLKQSKSNGATREALTKKDIEELSIILPPLPLQNQFAERIEAIEKQKELINKSIVDVQLLFDYTMDKYFN